MSHSTKQPGKLTRKIISPVLEFIRDSRAVGIVLMVCTAVSLIISNSAWSDDYIAFWQKELHMPLPGVELPHTIGHVINDALMAVFFLLAGLEIKRELLVGELSGVKKAMLPVIAAIGGMVVPALLFVAWNGGTALNRGWGIPMATDIAFSLGILSLLGKRVPLSLKIFLTALAIIDDLGGIVTIAIFYAKEIDVMQLFMGGAILFLLIMMNLMKVKRYYPYFVFGAIMWYFIFNSGVHATVAGVLLAFAIPMQKIEDLIHSLHDPVNFLIMPIFALANTAIVLPADVGFILTSKVHHGILSGLVLGKPLGIFFFTWFAVRIGIAEMPKGINRRHILGMGMIAGIGFTISIFMATLAYDLLPEVETIAKVAVIMASLLSGLLGFFYLKFAIKKTTGKTAGRPV